MTIKKSKNIRKAVSAIESVLVALAFSPWLILIYLFVSTFVLTLPTKDQDTIKGFIEWFGTAYSLFLALVLVNVWGQFETVDREFDLELDAVTTLYQTIKGSHLPSVTIDSEQLVFQQTKNFIIENIKYYVEHVRKNFDQEHLTLQHQRNGDIYLENIGSIINSLAFNKNFPETLVARFYDSLSQAMDARGDRLSHTKQHTRGVVLLVAYVSSFVWLLSFFGLVINNHWVAIVLIGGVTFVITMVVTIIRDLDNPFQGAWQVDLSDWDGLMELITPRVDVIFIYNLEGTLTDDIKHLVGKSVCKLKKFSRSFIKWRAFLVRVIREHEDASRSVTCKTLYLESFKPYAVHVLNPIAPMVIFKQGDRFELLLDSMEINNCSDIESIETLFVKKMRKFFPWY